MKDFALTILGSLAGVAATIIIGVPITMAFNLDTVWQVVLGFCGGSILCPLGVAAADALWGDS